MNVKTLVSNLQLPILGSVVKWGPSPLILDDRCTKAKQSLQNAIVPPAGSKVQRSSTFSVLAGQADISASHLHGDTFKKKKKQIYEKFLGDIFTNKVTKM